MKKTIRVISAVLAVVMSLLVLTSCKKNEDTINIEGVVADHNGVSAQGLTLVIIDSVSNDFSASIGENGKFTAYGVPVGSTLALSVEDSNGNGLSQIAYLTIKRGDKTEDLMNGSNINGYLGVNCAQNTKTLYITLSLDNYSNLAVRYCSDEGPEDTASTVPETTQQSQTTKSSVLF